MILQGAIVELTVLLCDSSMVSSFQQQAPMKSWERRVEDEFLDTALISCKAHGVEWHFVFYLLEDVLLWR